MSPRAGGGWWCTVPISLYIVSESYASWCVHNSHWQRTAVQRTISHLSICRSWVRARYSAAKFHAIAFAVTPTHTWMHLQMLYSILWNCSYACEYDTYHSILDNPHVPYCIDIYVSTCYQEKHFQTAFRSTQKALKRKWADNKTTLMQEYSI